MLRSGIQALAGKYREVIISILLFIILDLGVLILNYYISFQIQGDAVAVNLAGRQRMLSQRTTKVLYQLREADGKSEPLVQELQTSYQLFDSTLTAFDKGGSVMGGDNKPVTIAAVTDANARVPLEKALSIWTAYGPKIQTLLASGSDRAIATIDDAIVAANANNLQLLKLMNEMTTALEQAAQGKGTTLRLIQTIAIVLVLINFAVIMVHVIGKLKRSDQAIEEHSLELENANSLLAHSNGQLEVANFQLEEASTELAVAKQESDTIFAAVRQGLFLLGRDGQIGAQTSKELRDIFQTEAFADRSFLHLLRPLLPEKKYQTVADFLDLLFDPRKNDKQLQKFNPLKCAELNFPNPQGGFLPKHVEFTFQRIVSGGQVARVLVTAHDATDRVKLEEQLKVNEERREKQFELLFELLQVDSLRLRQFIETATASLERINGIFMERAGERGPGLGGALHDKVQRVFRIAHNLKAQAAGLGLLLFEKAIHQIEDRLGELRRLPELVSEDLLTVLVSISNFQTELEQATELIAKAANLRRTFGTSAAESETTPSRQVTLAAPAPVALPSQQLRATMDNLCATILPRLHKQARIEWVLEGFDTLAAPSQKALSNAAVQLVRNSLVHGLEMPAERTRLGKDPVGTIKLELRPNGPGQYLLSCRDDGSGLDTASIREKALREGLIDHHTARTATDDELCALIFEPGFSTAGEVTEDAGRGVGLDALKAEIMDELDGQISIEFATGRYCKFAIALPA